MTQGAQRALRITRPLRRDLGRLGWQGRIGLALVLASGLLVALAGWQERGDETPAEGSRPASAPANPEVPPKTIQSPTVLERDLHESVRLLFSAAQAHKIELSEGDYRVASASDATYRIYGITLPVKGSYAQLRAFLAECLRSNPKLSLDALEFRREQIGEEALQARVKFSLFIAAK